MKSVKALDEHAYAALFTQLDADDGITQIFIRFRGKPINVIRKVYRIDINTFVSSVGGSMGLFLGFSIYSTLLTGGRKISEYCRD